MAKTRLTPFSKLLIVAVILGILGYALMQLRSPAIKDKINDITKTKDSDNGKTTEGYKDVINIGVVTWGGYAGGQYFNKGFDANTESQFYKDYGFKVKFEVIDDFDASRDAFKNGDIDL